MRYLFFLSFLMVPILSLLAQNEDDYFCVPTLVESPTPNVLCPNFSESGDNYVISELISTFNCSVHINDEDPNCVEYLPLPVFENLTDSIIVIVCDTLVDMCDTIRYAIHIGCLNPIVLEDNVTIGNNKSFVIDVLKNDYDVCDRPIHLSQIMLNEGGLVSISDDEKVIYFQPNEGFVGTVEIDYITTNECGLPSQSKAIVDVQSNYQATFFTEEISLMINEMVMICPDFINIGEDIVIQGFTSLSNTNISINEEGNCLEYIASSEESLDELQIFACRPDVEICDTAYINIEVIEGSTDTVSALYQLPIKNDWMFIAPNPIKENLKVYFEEAVNEPVMLVVFDLNGQKVIEKKILPNNDAISLFVKIPTGTYFVEVSSLTKRSIKKIIILE